MPRQNKPREVLAEDHLARRIAAERDARGWTNDGLAKRMTDAGCAMTGSAIFKIEKSEPRRRIVVDELVAFGKVFGIPVDELLLPPEALLYQEVARLVIDWNYAREEAAAATAKSAEAWDAVRAFVADHPESEDELAKAFDIWAGHYFDDHDRGGAVALKMFEVTDDERWWDVVRSDIDRRKAERVAKR